MCKYREMGGEKTGKRKKDEKKVKGIGFELLFFLSIRRSRGKEQEQQQQQEKIERVLNASLNWCWKGKAAGGRLTEVRDYKVILFVQKNVYVSKVWWACIEFFFFLFSSSREKNMRK